LVAAHTERPAELAAAALQSAFAEFTLSTAQLADQDSELLRSVEQLRQDLAQAHTRLHDETTRRTRSEAQLGSMFELAPFGLVAIDGGQVTAFNAAAAALLPGLAAQSAWSLPAQWRRRGDSDEYLTDRGPLGRCVTVSPLVVDTERGTQLLRLEDITEALLQRAVLERQERLAAMGRMTAELAHQLRTPLCTATLYASQLAEADIDEADRRQMAGRLGSQLTQLDALITRMLSFVKTSARENKQVSVLGLLVRAQLEVIAPLLAQRSLRLALNIDDTDSVIAIDRLQIGSAVLALLENALQHAPTASMISVSCVSQGHRVEVSVADEGPGIAPEMAARLFEPFATGSATGTGLGLAIARAAAQAHGGELSCTARKPRGVCFTLALPAMPKV
jgi:two-component system sensor histidine kinase FlrB